MTNRNADQHQVRRHYRNVDEVHRLDEQQPHARPLEHLLGDDREGDDTAELHAGDGDDRHQRVFQRVTEVTTRSVSPRARANLM